MLPAWACSESVLAAVSTEALERARLRKPMRERRDDLLELLSMDMVEAKVGVFLGLVEVEEVEEEVMPRLLQDEPTLVVDFTLVAPPAPPLVVVAVVVAAVVVVVFVVAVASTSMVSEGCCFVVRGGATGRDADVVVVAVAAAVAVPATLSETLSSSSPPSSTTILLLGALIAPRHWYTRDQCVCPSERSSFYSFPECFLCLVKFPQLHSTTKSDLYT